MKLRKTSIATGGTFVSAVLSFLPLACCAFPLAFAFLGAGSLAFAVKLMPYRPYFIALTIIFLGIGFYFAYRPLNEECADGKACAKPESRKVPRIMLWTVTIFVFFVLALPYILPYLPI